MITSLVPYNEYEAQSAYYRLRSTLSVDSPEEALREIRTFLKMFPENPLAYNDLGALYFQIGDNLQALAHYEKANRLQPNNPTVIKNLAEFYFVVLRWTDDAIEMLTGLLKNQPNDFEVLTAIGNISVQVGRPEEGRTFYRKALQLDPENQELRELLAKLEGPVSAAEYRSESIAAPRSSVPHQMCAEPEKQEDSEEAPLRRLLEQNPRNAVAHNNLGLLRYRQGRMAEAALCYEKAVELDPANPTYRKNLADLYYAEIGRTDDAIELYSALHKEFPKDSEVLISLAIICRANNLKEQAKMFISKVIELEPWNADARDFLAGL